MIDAVFLLATCLFLVMWLGSVALFAWLVQYLTDKD